MKNMPSLQHEQVLERKISAKNIASGTISGLLAITGSSLIILEAARNGGYDAAETASWIFATFFFGGLFSILLPLYHKMPLTGAHSISGITYLMTVTPLFAYTELIGGFFISGLLIFLLGVTGLFSKIINILPKEIIFAMLAGMILNTLVHLSVQFTSSIWIVISAMIGFLLVSQCLKNIPAIFGALLFAAIALLIGDGLPSIQAETEANFFQFYQPEFSIAGVFLIGLPLALLLLSNDIIVGVNELVKNKFAIPANRIVSLSGLFSITGSFFGSHCTNLAGVMTSICSNASAGKKAYRYMASVISGFILMLFAFASPILIPFILELPDALPAIIAFLALFGIFTSSLKASVKHKTLNIATIPTMVISASPLTFYSLNGPLIGLSVGLLLFIIIHWQQKKKVKHNQAKACETTKE